MNAPNDTVRMDLFSHLGFYYYSKNGDSSHFYLERGISIAQNLNLKLFEANLSGARAYLLAWNNYPKAFELLLQTLKIAEDPRSEKTAWNLPPGRTAHAERLGTLGFAYFSLAQLYGNTGNTEMQVSNLLKTAHTAESIGDSALNLLANLNLGNVYQTNLKKLDSALYYEQKALGFFPNSQGSESDIGWVYNTIGTIYQEKGNFYEARDVFRKGLNYMQQQNNLAGVGGICLALSNFYKVINEPDSSLLYAYSALETYKKFKDLNGIANAYSSLSSAYAEQKKGDSAFSYLKLATALHDSLNNAERKNLLTYQNVSFGEQMRLKNLGDEKIQTQNKIRAYAMLAGIAVFMTIAFLLYRNAHHRKKANLILQKQKEEIATQKESVEKTLHDLKAAQSQLIQSEKMASLGELTAGIAHEIQNPLNFVNNFSEVNKELLAEMNDEIKKGNLAEVKAIAIDVIANEEKISHHGKRADAIVKGMLQHSRSSSGVKEPTNINALADEYLRLAYHGLKAKDKSFNAKLETGFDNSIQKINVVPQDIGRVILNLITNAFYAVNEKKKSGELSAAGYEPLVSVKTKKLNDTIEISVEDNGNGIPEPIKEKIFQPFFTTKPTGQGTGLGLSLSYDIVKAHGGELKVETKEGEDTVFVIQLPAKKDDLR
ncbi:MAG: hypothetical protein JSS70_10865 [Bacteroidetes bacterium]|nr:hypothetical protein [Bacteroidota bacterium]